MRSFVKKKQRIKQVYEGAEVVPTGKEKKKSQVPIRKIRLKKKAIILAGTVI